MKKLFLLLIFIAGFISLNAQNPDDLIISGYVTNSSNIAVANQQVCVASDTSNPYPFNQCVYTNANGWYTITVTNGSITGSNQNYKVYTAGCTTSFIHQYVSNNQGTVDAITVNFTNVDPSSVGGTISGGTTPLTLGASTGPLVLSNNVGTVIKWEKRLNGGVWTTINFTGITYSETPSLCGTWEYRAVVQNGNCVSAFSSSVSIVVICQTICDAGFTFQVSGLNVHFFSTNTDTTAQHSWYFGNGTTSTVINPTISFPTAGVYTICHYVYVTGTSCVDSVCQTITIGNTTNCLVTYSYNNQNLLPNQVQFNGILTSGTGAYSWYWSFGDGTTGQGQNPLHQYAQPGLYSACVYLHNNNGTIICQYCDSVNVPVSPAGCQAYFTFSQSGTAVSFNSANSIFPSGPVLYNWNFGDSTTSTLANPIHTFTTNGTYNICLTISTNNCTDTYCHTITIGQSNVCNISFTFAQNPNGAYIFTPNFPTTIINPQFVWHFGDGQISNLQQPVHAYVNPGNYSVCLTISGSGITCTYCDSAYFNSTVNACNASFNYQISGLTVTFTSPMINTLTNHYWNFGNGSSSSLANPTVTYTTPGTYTVCHHVWNTSCADTACVTITVGTTVNCNVSFTYNTQNLLPAQVQFFGQISPNVGTYYWHWSFGDGQSVSGQQNPIHQYAQPGYYSVCVNILQSNGTISCSYCDTIYVSQTPSIICNANFTFQQNGATVHFYHNNSGTPSSTTMQYYWDFGDGTSSTAVNPTHTYLSAGVYSVCLSVTDSLNNCYDQYCVNITIGNNTNCQASFQFTYGSLYNVAFFGHFTPLSTAMQWQWDFGDSTYANIQNPIHNFPGPGTYNVCLKVITTSGICPVTVYCQTITIQGNTPGCQAYFTYQINNANVHFTAVNNSITPNQFLHYYWVFGDSTTSNLQNPIHTYTAMGTYTVCLTIIDSLNGCSDQFCQTITLGNNVQLSGQILCGNNPADMGTVYLLSVTPGSSNGILPVASTPILAGGYYQFSNIPYGQYLIQAHLAQTSIYYFNYLPTYYGDVLYWSQAIFVSIGQVNLTVQYDINMIGTNLNNGNGQISGNVFQGTGNKSTSEDVLIILLDEFDTPVTYTYSDVNGYFEFNNLALGTYKIFAEIWGKDPVSASVLLDSDNPTVDNVVITVNELNVIASLSGFNAFYFDYISNPYPNPTQSDINIDVSLKQNAQLTINVYNILGVSIYAESTSYSSGVHRMNFSTANLPAGLYYIDIVADNKFRVSKMFNKIK